jgi:hypothetical protein
MAQCCVTCVSRSHRSSVDASGSAVAVGGEVWVAMVPLSRFLGLFVYSSRVAIMIGSVIIAFSCFRVSFILALYVAHPVAVRSVTSCCQLTVTDCNFVLSTGS